MVDLAACQDMIHEESQSLQQFRRQIAGQHRAVGYNGQPLPQLVDDLRAHREQSELWAVGTRDVVDYRDGGRSLRQSTIAGDTLDGGRPPRGVDSSYGRPVGHAVGGQAWENHIPPEDDDVRSFRMHNSPAEREPRVQARDQSPPRTEQGFRAPAERKPRVQARDQSPPRAEQGFRVSSERPRYKTRENRGATLSRDHQADDVEVDSCKSSGNSC